MSFFVLWLRAFVFTQVVEIPVYRKLLGVRFWYAFGASAITHPIVWAVFVRRVFLLPYSTRVVLAETFAVVAEAIYFHIVTRSWRAWPVSLLANALSFGLGLISYRWFHFP